MAVRVRLFAAVREAAGIAEVEVDPGPLPFLLQELRDRFGQPFTDRLVVCSVLVDGVATPHQAEVPVDDGAEVVLLPPVSGGAADAAGHAPHHGREAATARGGGGATAA